MHRASCKLNNKTEPSQMVPTHNFGSNETDLTAGRLQGKYHEVRNMASHQAQGMESKQQKGK